jgi:hypothetical protein
MKYGYSLIGRTDSSTREFLKSKASILPWTFFFVFGARCLRKKVGDQPGSRVGDSLHGSSPTTRDSVLRALNIARAQQFLLIGVALELRFTTLSLPLSSFTPYRADMLARTCLRGFGLQSLPKRQAYQLARRSVTTDAASSHAEKDDVPDVRCPVHMDKFEASPLTIDCRRMTSRSPSSSLTRASRPTTSILRRTPSTPRRRS